MNLFGNFVSFKMDDARELRVTSGPIIGVVMLLLVMMPKDIKGDFVSRLHEMNLTEEQAEHNKVVATRDATENDDLMQATTASDGEIIDDPHFPESDGELSELFETKN